MHFSRLIFYVVTCMYLVLVAPSPPPRPLPTRHFACDPATPCFDVSRDGWLLFSLSGSCAKVVAFTPAAGQ